MEPFVKMGGQVGSDIRVWRDLSGDADEAQMDEAARQGLAFSRDALDSKSPRGTGARSAKQSASR
jgi:D-psicose/D-tagatose/L-ribulose 3-epimerase